MKTTTLEHKGYVAVATFDDATGDYDGSVVNSGAYGIVVFEGLQRRDLQREFEISIDEYLNSCEEDGVEPLPPEPLGEFLSERLHLRLDETLLGRVQQAARDSDQSLDCWVAQALERSLAAETPTPEV
ncbi:MAG: type II toxin-antitoxin system HicB family antitoxin [Anaerolineaceae bacterium]|nr:type II toxin-antitoxin system HicB family antitoxin [Anaerolineaceae bacterium]MCY4023178.1 type II toxin-antitoxin system HicB family antitoxin [Anaerolineaceae bacterium]